MNERDDDERLHDGYERIQRDADETGIAAWEAFWLNYAAEYERLARLVSDPCGWEGER